jgi:hypothetical protein
MTAAELAVAGRAVYGERWQRSLASDLHVSDRTVRRWLAGEFPVPASVVRKLRKILADRMRTIGGMLRFTINPADQTILHSISNAMFCYDEEGNVSLLHPGVTLSQELPLITEGAKEALRQEGERDPRVKGMSIDPKTGRSATARRLHGFMRGSVVVPPDVDLTAPVIDEPFDVETDDMA